MTRDRFPIHDQKVLTASLSAGYGFEREARVAFLAVRDQLQHRRRHVQEGQYRYLGGRDFTTTEARSDRRAGRGLLFFAVVVSEKACRADSRGLRPQDEAAEEAKLSGADAPRPGSSIPAGVKLRQRKKPAKPKRRLVVVHEDLINDAWWESGRGADLLSG